MEVIKAAKRAWRKLLRPRRHVPDRHMSQEPRIILLASGEQSRWHGHGPKQLVSIDGEPLLLRTLRQLETRTPVRPVVVTHCKEIERAVSNQADVFALPPGQRRWAVETALHTSMMWGDPTWILLADVYWTDATLERIMRISASDPPRYFISSGLSTGVKSWYEILGLWFRWRHRNLMASCFYHALLAAERGRWGKLWDSYRSLCGFRLHRYRLEDRHRFVVDDGSTDFDSVEEYQAFLSQNERRAA